VPPLVYAVEEGKCHPSFTQWKRGSATPRSRSGRGEVPPLAHAVAEGKYPQLNGSAPTRRGEGIRVTACTSPLPRVGGGKCHPLLTQWEGGSATPRSCSGRGEVPPLAHAVGGGKCPQLNGSVPTVEGVGSLLALPLSHA
jgi:hypothetical protein